METKPPSIMADSTTSVAEAILRGLHARGFRRTAALRNLILEMVSHPAPAPIAYWASLPALSELNLVTIYRLIMKLEQAGVVRGVHLGERAQCYQLIQSGQQPDYLICTNCGDLQPVAAPPELRLMEQQLAAISGWKAVRHELEFFGLCPDCTESHDEQKNLNAQQTR